MIYAWYSYLRFTQLGIFFSNGITAIDQANYRINANVISIYLDNTINTSVYQTDNRRIFRSDGDYPVKVPTSSGYGIDIVWRNTVLIAETGVSGLTAQESLNLAQISSVKSKTDLLDFIGSDLKATLDGEEVVTDLASRNASKANVSGLSTFNPVTDTVANVTLVATTTTNTDMRGTNNANTIVPTNETLTFAQNEKLNSLNTDNLDVAISTRATRADADQALTDYNVDTKTNIKPSISI